MSITTITQLRTFMGLTDSPVGGADSLETAEVLVASYIGAATLAETVQAEKVTPARDRSTLEVALAPITTFTSATYGTPAVSVTDTSVDDNSRWAVRSTNGFSRGVEYTTNYTSGWTSVTLPAEVMRAICATAELLLDGGGRGVAAESVGDYSRTSGPSGMGSLPPMARDLLLPWRRPQT